MIPTKHLKRLLPPTAATEADFAKSFAPVIQNHPPLPIINWSAVGQPAPQLLAAPAGDLPAADAIVITWAEAEWSAMEHVFCNSGVSMPYGDGSTSTWSGWQKYTKGIPSVPNQSSWNYWGSYRLVQIGGSKVLLFKSNTHLDYPGQPYLQQLVSLMIATVKPQLILSIGTAGGARVGDHIGSVNVVRAGTLYETNQPQAQWPDYTNAWKANWSLIAEPGFAKLLFPVPTTQSDLQSICQQFNSFYKSNYALSELNVNNLNLADPAPAINNLTGTSTALLTTNSFVVGTSSGNLGGFACVEMDDAIIAKVCASQKTAFGFVRNISDPVQNATLAPEFQAHWGEAIYGVYGLYTSYNGALAAWAILSGQFK